MKIETKKFLEFNGKTIFFISADGQYWIAIKPICEALNVEYTRQFKNLKKDEFLKAALATQPMQAPDNQVRSYAALPENLVYGWLMQIQSASPELQKYKWECYQVLYQYFHGAITGRKDLLLQRAKAQMQVEKAMNSLDPEMAITLERSTKIINQVNAKLRALDGEMIQEERDLFSKE